MVSEFRDSDPNKRVNCRKRTFVVDTQGRLWEADVGAVNKADGALAAPPSRSILCRCCERLANNLAMVYLPEHWICGALTL
jgi:hypothetical protein